MAKRMLVDATHPEETRVVVVNGNRLEDLDFEIASRKQLKGNIYLAKVTRVEPSLQAAFVEYGGNRHGFLAFTEIHPDYYRIPTADREALLAEEERLRVAEERRLEEREAAEAAREAEVEAAGDAGEREFLDAPQVMDEVGGSREENGEAVEDRTDEAEEDDGPGGIAAGVEGEEISEPAVEPAPEEKPIVGNEIVLDEMADGAEAAAEIAPIDEVAPVADVAAGDGPEPDHREFDAPRETLGGASDESDESDDDEVEDGPRRRARPLRSYKIQEVVKRRQIMLVQVTKEERGNKGAALTTYLSLPGRYCVLMPNTGRGGGISRKITNPVDRRRLKDILSDLDVPRGMAVILRTAGLERDRKEIKRDLEYLLRLWDDIREQTLKSSAPALIYEEANLIKRAIRDVYNDDIDEIHVEGEEGFKTAREFMRMLMPTHVGRVKRYTDESIPLFHRYQIETQIDAIHNPVVQLRSGGYIVINPTEALVAVDVNSGKSTRERNIEETALKTNIEAAEEVARQLRLRDLAGLVVIDFIDMEEPRNNVAVERRLKDAMRTDRARIQLGRISAFGLLELSRQRLRPSLLETNFERCPHCAGTGVIRSVESAALHALRAIEEEGLRKRSAEVTVYVPTRIALYILNAKRGDLVRVEERYRFRVNLLADDELIAPDIRIERTRAKTPEEEVEGPITADKVLAEAERDAEVAAEAGVEDEPEVEEVREGVGDVAGDADRRPRRRRRRRGGRDRDGFEGARAPVPGEDADAAETGEVAEADAEGGEEAAPVVEGEGVPARVGDDENGFRRRRRRGKRGGRRRTRIGENGETVVEGETVDDGEDGDDGEISAPASEKPVEPVIRAVLPPPGSLSPMDPMDFDWILNAEPEPVVEAAPVVVEEPVAAEPPIEEPVVEVKPARKRATRKKKTTEPAEALVEAAPTPVVAEAPVEEPSVEAKPARKRATRKKKTAEPAEAPVEAVPTPVVAETPVEEPVPVAPAVETVVQPPVEENVAAKAAENVNQAPPAPKRGWWNR